MPRKRERDATREDLAREEREIGENLPDAMIGEDDGDVRDVRRQKRPG